MLKRLEVHKATVLVYFNNGTTGIRALQLNPKRIKYIINLKQVGEEILQFRILAITNYTGLFVA